MSWWGWDDSDSEDDAAVEQILASFRHRSSLRANLEDPQSMVLHDPDLLLSIMVQHAAVITEQGGVVTEAGLHSYLHCASTCVPWRDAIREAFHLREVQSVLFPGAPRDTLPLRSVPRTIGGIGAHVESKGGA